jgi:hypothetical protein
MVRLGLAMSPHKYDQPELDHVNLAWIYLGQGRIRPASIQLVTGTPIFSYSF